MKGFYVMGVITDGKQQDGKMSGSNLFYRQFWSDFFSNNTFSPLKLLYHAVDL